jgi:hypothetical protein
MSTHHVALRYVQLVKRLMGPGVRMEAVIYLPHRFVEQDLGQLNNLVLQQAAQMK